MSRIGKQPITLPAGVTVKNENNTLFFEGPKGKLTAPVPKGITAEEKDGTLQFTRTLDDGQTRAFHGLARSLAKNCVIGITEGFKRQLSVRGVGYRVKVSGNNIELNLGYSHPITFALPEGVAAKSEEDRATKSIIITLEGTDKQKVGQTAAEIRSLRKPEPYKGKGIRYIDEYVKIKAGKTGK